MPDGWENPADDQLVQRVPTHHNSTENHMTNQPTQSPNWNFGLDVAGEVNILRDICHGDAERAGWWLHEKSDLREIINKPDTTASKMLGGALVAQKLCLVHSEVSEAMEGHRKGLMDDHIPSRSMLEVELADALIRIFDLAGAMKLDLGGAMAEKMAYNRQRADHKPEARMAAGGKAY